MMRTAQTLLVICVLGLLAPAARASTEEDTWLANLSDRVVDDLVAGKPLVVEVHVPLCDNSIIACGNAKLGDGDNPDTNLYWWTTPGFGTWFARKGSGWTRVTKLKEGETGDKDVLALHVYKRSVSAPAAWKKRGVPAKFEIDIRVRAWRGKAIDRALAAYAADVSGASPAQIVAWVGHNRLMDLDAYQWPKPGADTKGAIAIACHTAAYMEDNVPAATRVPLLMTRDFLFANAAPLEAAVLSFASGGSYAQIRLAAATAYAGVQERQVKQVYGAFTNPADKRWKKK